MLFRDFIGVEIPKLDAQTTDLAVKAIDGKTKLVVTAKATFSGYLLNGRVYPGIHMRDATGTWCDAAHGGRSMYNKPVLVNHDLDADPVGRVAKASFHSIKSGRDFTEDFKNPDTSYPGGSGFIQLSLHVTNPDAIEKCLRGEYLTLSTAYDSNITVCSVCGTNIAEEKWCGHLPGKRYEVEDEDQKVLCYFVPGPMVYREVSFVNQPAQPQAVISTMSLEDAAQVFPVGTTNLGVRAEIALFRDSEQIMSTAPSETGKVRRRRSISVAAKIDGDKASDPKRALLQDIVDDLVAKRALKSDSLMVSRWPFVGVSSESGMDHVHVFFGSVNPDGKVTGFSWYEGPMPTGEAQPEYHGHSIDAKIEDFNAKSVDVSSSESEGHSHTIPLVLHPVQKEEGDTANSLDTIKKMVEIAEYRIGDQVSADARSVSFESRLSDLGSDAQQLGAVLEIIGYAKVDDATAHRMVRGVAERVVELGLDKVLRLPAEEKMTKPTEPSKNEPADNGADIERFRTLTDEVAQKTGELKSLTVDRDNKVKELESATKRIAELESALHQSNCDRLALARAFLRDEDCETPEQLKALSTELVARSKDSVLDGLKDIDKKLPRALKSFHGVSLGTLMKGDEAQPAAPLEPETDKQDKSSPAATDAI